MLKRAVTGDGKDVKIDFDRVLVSAGSLMPVFEGTATQDRDKMYFNWQDNSSMGNAESADIAMLLVYNKDKETAVYDTEAALRSDRHTELSLPNDWEGDELVAYLSFCSADGSCVSNSVRLSVSVFEIAEDEIQEQTGTTEEKHEKMIFIPKGEVQIQTVQYSSCSPPHYIHAWKFKPPL